MWHRVTKREKEVTQLKQAQCRSNNGVKQRPPGETSPLNVRQKTCTGPRKKSSVGLRNGFSH